MSKRSRKKRSPPPKAPTDTRAQSGDAAAIGALFAPLRPAGESLDADWLRGRIESLDAALEVANERLQRSLRRQGEAESQAEADRERAAHLEGADERARELARALEESRAEANEALVRARSLAAERDHLEAELSRLGRTLEEREKTLARLAAEAGRERLALLEKLESVESLHLKAERERAEAQAEAVAYHEESQRLSDHLTLREKTLAETARQGATERERFMEELSALQERLETQGAEAGRRESGLREELARARSEEQLLRQLEGQLRQSLESEQGRAQSLEGRLAEQAERVQVLDGARAQAEREGQGLRGELSRLCEERDQLARIIDKREQSLREELVAARSERERQRSVIEEAGTRHEQLLRDHERLCQHTLQLELDSESLTKSATQERERARGLAAEVVTLEDRVRELTAQLERARRESTTGEPAAIEAELSAERERLSTEVGQLRSQGEALAARLRQAEQEASQAQAARAALNERAEAAEALVRERLRSGAPSAAPEQEAPPEVGRRLGTLEGRTEQIGRSLGKIERLLAQQGPRAGASQALSEAADRQARELQGVRQELAHLAKTRGSDPARAGGPPPQRRPGTPLGMAGALAALFLLAGALAALYWNFERTLTESQAATEQIIETALRSSAAAAQPLALPRLSSPPAGSTVRGAHPSVQGEAPGAEAVFLFLNETLFAVTLARGGRFEFADVPLEIGKTKLALRSVDSNGRASERLETLLLRPPPPGAAIPPRVRDLLRGPKRRREIALTFDGDTSSGATHVLDTLRAEGIKTTVFLTGTFIRDNPDLVRRIVAEGHEVGNHTWDHPHLTTFDQNSRHDTRPEVSKAFFQGQLIRTASRFEELTGRPIAPFWRAPYGEVNTELMRWAKEIGYRHVNWTRDYGRGETLDSLDWVSDPGAHNYYTGPEIVQRLLSFGRGTPAEANGGIVLMHLGTNRKNGEALYERLPEVIAGWRGRGYRFVKVSEWVKTREHG